MDFQAMIDRYEFWLEFSKIKTNAAMWIGAAIVIAIVIGALAWILSSALIQEATLLPFAFFLATLTIALGYPYMRKEQILDEIEADFSDALKQMADTLKAGDTYESALRDIANSDYGRLSEEMMLALRRLEEGENLETSLTSFAQRIDSRLIKRTITIILDSIKTGASLADVLEEIAEDVRDIYRLKQDRKANTTMQFLFMIAAGGFIAPMIFGEVTSVLTIFAKISASAVDAATIAATKKTSELIVLIIQGYLIIAVIGTGVMMSITREGKINKSIIYIPFLLLVAFLMYYASSFIIRSMIAGSV